MSVDRFTIKAPFSVSLSGSNPIAKDRAGLFEIVYEARDTEPAFAELQVETNDPDEPVATVAVQVKFPCLRSGDHVPDLVFTDLEGFQHRLQDQRGRPVLLAYFATF